MFKLNEETRNIIIKKLKEINAYNGYDLSCEDKLDKYNVFIEYIEELISSNMSPIRNMPFLEKYL